ncbi:MAG: glucose-1-phosphate thymidylyltransferase [Pirellulaceae bacterium]|nr:MAG: glucose-1-phosphate thymidylyltransferase [Pirellulaceae bacterium]
MTDSATVPGSPFRKAILMAGGSGSRLHPMTRVINKQLLPVYDKPLVYYPLSVIMLAGIRQVLVISSNRDVPAFRELLGDGSQWGMRFEYAVQQEPRGIAEAFLVGEEFIAGEPVVLVLGDNIFYGQGLREKLLVALGRDIGATVFAYPVRDPQRYGVVEFDEQGRAIAVWEKPRHSRSRYAITGLYFYDAQVTALARQLKPSLRGELEITDINRWYLEQGRLHVERFGRGFAWLDCGTEHSLLQAANFVEMVQERQGFKIACPEEVAYRMGFIDAAQLRQLAGQFRNPYGEYLTEIAESG